MDTSSYTVIPANSKCIYTSTIKVVSNNGTATSDTSKGVDGVLSQMALDSQFDSSAVTPKSLYGGKKNLKNFKIIFKKKILVIEAYNEINAIKIFLNKKVFKKDNIINVNNKLYIIRANSLNKIIQIY